ncbi:FAD-dependent monooxygenase [Prauserella flavalba]|uniref:FAD-dependent monooxygenase n=1 Tax=Prauserella flavalba TaxID=1477506 RepID=UPI0036EB1D0E
MSTYYRPEKYPASDVPCTDEVLPVVIAGAGPVGMAVALGLARRGVPVTLLEAADQVSFGSRAICVSRHSLEVAHRLGFGERLEKIVLPWVGGRSFHRDTEVLRFAMPYAAHAVRPPMVNVSQSELEQVMVEAIEDQPLISLYWGAEVVACGQDDEEVRLDVSTAAGTRRLRARWVVAADGGRSRLRSLLGLRMTGTSYEGSYVIADIHWPSALPAERLVWFDAPSNPGSTIIMHRQPRDIWRIDYQVNDAADAEAETEERRIRDRITRHLEWLDNDVPWTLEWHGFYRAHALALPDFAHGRVVFAGDAAHLVPIFGVRGLNSGMEDAETLAWQLAAVVHGSADAELLEAYSAERHDAWQQNVANAGKSTMIMSPGGHGYRTTRDAVLVLAERRPEFAGLLNPRQSSATHAHRSPLTWPTEPDVSGLLPGDPLEDRRVRVLAESGVRVSSLSAERGSGFTVLAAGVNAERAEQVAWWAERLATQLAPEPVRAVVAPAAGTAVTPTGELRVLDDPDGDLATALGSRAGEVFVIRPDGLVLCRVTDPGRLADIVGHLVAGTRRSGRPSTVPPQPVEVDDRERNWLALSSALDEVGADDREGFLTRLALLLGEHRGELFEEAIAGARLSGRAP